MSEEQLTISFDEAVKLLPEGDTIHTFRNSGSMLLGADWGREALLAAMRDTEIHITGKAAQAMKHGLAIIHNGSWLFIEAANADRNTPQESAS